MLGLAYWLWPLVSAVVWLATLLGLFLTWIVEETPYYDSMEPRQVIPFISDIGATYLKPLFIAGSCVTVITLNASLIAERWARHTGKLYRNTSVAQKVLSVLAIIAAIVGGIGLILLTIFDTKRYQRLHNTMLAVFIGGYLFSAVFNCIEHQRLAHHARKYAILRVSFWFKLVFIIVELALAITFGVLQRQSRWDASAVVEWIIAIIFTFYVLSFILDFLPVVQRHHHHTPEPAVEMAEEEAAQPAYANGGHRNDPYQANGRSHHAYATPQNGHLKEERPLTPSYNF